MIPKAAHLDPRFKSFPNLREEQYESILAVPILARERLEGALNVRTEAPREFGPDEVDLLMAIAGQVAQAIENAKLYDHAQRRVAELEALASISEAVSESLYLEESLEAIVKTTMAAVDARGRRSSSRTGRSRGRRESRRACGPLPAPLARPGGRGAGVRPRHAVHRRGRAPPRVDRASRRRGARARASGHARGRRPGDPPPGQEQPPDGRIAAASPVAGARDDARRRSPTPSTASSRSRPCTRS